MRLRALRLFLLPILFAIALTPPPAFAQSPSDAELKSMSSRVAELYQAGKYGDAIPLVEQICRGGKSALRRERARIRGRPQQTGEPASCHEPVLPRPSP